MSSDYALAMQTFELDWLVPDWPAPLNVRALCTSREGGQSIGRYAGLNLGLHVGDDPQLVRSNRWQLQAQMGVPTVFLNQVHGMQIAEIDAQSTDGIEADGAVTTATALACTVMVADCLPVLLCDAQGLAVAAAHAGWRGLLGAAGQGVLERAVSSLCERAAVPTQGLLAWLGPCIGPAAFEVGEEVRAAFVADAAQAAGCFSPHGPDKWLADLPQLARQRLAALGVSAIYGNDGSQDWCTVANPSRFFSHRRDAVSGRLGACIWRVG